MRKQVSILYYRKFILYELELLTNKLWYLENINYSYNSKEHISKLLELRLELWEKVNYYCNNF